MSYTGQLLSVKIRKPTTLLSRPWETKLELIGRNPRDLDSHGVYLQQHAKVLMLPPQIRPENYNWTKASFSLTPEGSFFEGRDWEGAEGYYLGYTGTSAWSAWLSPSITIEADRGLQFTIIWSPPSGDVVVPRIEIFPRIDYSRQTTINGVTYYFAPLAFAINAQMVFEVYEYEYDSYEPFETNPSKMLVRRYQHPLITTKGTQIAGTFRIIPIESDGFVVESPMLKNGGFVYLSKLQRENLKLFPAGGCGIRSDVGGFAIFNFVPLEFPESGYVIGPRQSKRQQDDKWVTITFDAYVPTGTAVAGTIVDPETQEVITTGEVFQEFAYKVTLYSTDGIHTPVVNYVKCDVEGETESSTEDEIDVSDEVRIQEQISGTLMGHRATISLHNPNGEYTELALRPINEIDVDIKGQDRAIFYTLNPKAELWKTPNKEAVWLEWECGDMWVRLEHYILVDEDVYDGLDLKTAITTFLQRLGIPADKIDIDDEALSIILPKARGGNDPLFRPRLGSTAAEFLKGLYSKFCPDWIMRFRGDGTFELKPADNSTIARIYYLSHEVAEQLYQQALDDYESGLGEEPDPEDYSYFVSDLKIELLHDKFYNEIWVIGQDSATSRPLVSFWMDYQSQIDRDYLYFVGESRIMIVETRIGNQDALNWICQQLAKFYGKVRRRISFRTKFDPALWPGDFIQIYGYAPIYRIESIDTRIEPGTVTMRGGQPTDIVDCQITAIEWPT